MLFPLTVSNANHVPRLEASTLHLGDVTAQDLAWFPENLSHFQEITFMLYTGAILLDGRLI